MIGARDLSKYGAYNEHYVNRNQSEEDGSGQIPSGTVLKKQSSPNFFTVDTFISYQIHPAFQISLGVNNIFNYTQTKAGDSPTTWHWHFTHAHFDQLHTWGPNVGRQFFFNLKGVF